MVELDWVQWTAFVHYRTFKKLIQNAKQFLINQNTQEKSRILFNWERSPTPILFLPLSLKTSQV